MKMAFKYIITLILFFSNFAFAEYVMPGAVHISTKSYVPKYSEFNTGNYVYKISWQGIPVAKAEVQIKNPGNNWEVQAGAETNKWISTFYTLKFDSESIFSREDFKPKQFKSKQIENSKNKIKEVSFLSDGTITTNAYKNGKKEESISFNPDNQTLDPISAAFLARSLDIKVGSKKSFDVFNGKHRYLITFYVDGIDKLDLGKNKQVECFSVRPEVVKLTDTEGEKRLRYARIWISADSDREILKIESKVLIGSVKAELEKFVPNNEVMLVKAK